jgi:hypothetical protein
MRTAFQVKALFFTWIPVTPQTRRAESVKPPSYHKRSGRRVWTGVV